MNITVYLGANEGNDPSLTAAVRELGEWISRSGNHLVYGGSRPGLMGILADSVLASGGTVIGVQTQLFLQDECYHGLTELIVTQDLAERKAKMIELGDAFLAFPGGTGTLDEITEVISLASLDQIHAPVILYNLHGYYEGLRQQLRHMMDTGLSTAERQKWIYFADDLAQIQEILSSAQSQSDTPAAGRKS